MDCPYSDEDLEEWKGVSNPMGKPCYECKEHDCEHNPNPDPRWSDDDPMAGDLTPV